MSTATARQNQQSWWSIITFDLLLTVGRGTILHPFVAWMIPLSLRAQATPYHHLSFQISTAYALFLTTVYVLSVLDRRIAHGLRRPVDLSEEVVVITGGASGLGLLIADFYTMRGASVAVLDVKPKSAIQESKGITYYVCDVGDSEQVHTTAEDIKADLGTPTILVNNAAVVTGKSMSELTPSEVERSFRVNVISHFHTIREFLPGMLDENRGTIVTVGSVLGYLGCAKLSDYSAAKAALLAMHASLRAELRYSEHSSAKNIKTILVAPGQLGTPLFAGMKTPSAFLAPVVEPVELAKEIVKMIDSGLSGEIRMPFYADWVPVLQALPVSLQQVLRSWSGLDRAMLDFSRGRKQE